MPNSAKYNQAYYALNREAILARSAARYEQDPEAIRQRRRAYHDRLKNEVLDGYGAHCTCCGESNRGFLTLDHVNGGGRAHRKQVGGGTMLYLVVIKQGFPAEYQILCYNCNLGREHNGGICPHVTELEVTVGLSTA